MNLSIVLSAALIIAGVLHIIYGIFTNTATGSTAIALIGAAIAITVLES